MKKILFFSLVLLVWAGAHAQIKLTGVVRDVQTKEPVKDVAVTLLPNGPVLQTNAQGEFAFELKASQQVTLQFKHISYGVANKTISVEKGEANTTIDVFLEAEKTLLQPVEVSALRAGETTPVAFTDIDKEQISALNTGRDVPYLLEQTPSVIATSDAGAGIGYTNLRIRGSDITRINVTVNGIPINDAESHTVFWVNMPDLASSTNSLQLQRGVGTSTNGSAAFGASLNMETDGPLKAPNAQLHVGGGSFNTQRYTAQFGTGLLKNKWWMDGRLSKITSDGYVDRASSDLKSYYISGGFVSEKTTVRAVVFGGKEITYQAWNGVDSATMATNRTFNSAGALYDDAWNVTGFYDNEVDNYEQNHYQLHLNQLLTQRLKLNVSLHYTKGGGYYEQYKQSQYMPDYGIEPIYIGTDTIDYTDLIRRKWLQNDFYGAIFNVEYANSFLTSILGGGYQQYDGDHFGEVIWARDASQTEIRNRYYNSVSTKTDWNIYWKNLIKLNEKITAFVDVQMRSVKYSAAGTDDDVADFSFSQPNLFFNPKVGLTYKINTNDKIFASYAVANKEPNRTDLIYADPANLPRPEHLQDFELGYEFSGEKFQFKSNAFLMFYTDQLVLTGQLDNVGYPIRKNIGESYRIGIEFAMSWRPYKWVQWAPNVAYIQSQNLNYVEESDNGQVKPLGNTAIAYAPNTVFSSALDFYPLKGVTLGLFTQYVSRQYLNNSQIKRLSLDPYVVNNLQLSYDFKPTWIGGMRVYVSVNNVFNALYANNGYVWGSTPYFYPQAGINFLAGLQVTF